MGASQQQRFRATYFRDDGSYRELYSDLFTGDMTGIVQIRFDPLQGLLADVPGKSEAPLYLYTDINLERLIKYAVVQSYRYGSYAEHDDRIYNIRVSHAGSDYTVFHDNCNDMDEFHKDPAFPYGVCSDGELVVPSGQSHMTWSSIATGSGWHGPVYTHVLERPFRLYQLSEFSVVGELVQSASTMGKAYVALFDENKRIVMLIHWGDAWVGATKGWFKVYFYRQDSSSACLSSGYIYSSFKKTGKLWWDEYDEGGSDGAIMASIDGSSNAYLLVHCDNASRVIKYVVILGYRYYSYNLVRMGIHDINVVADLTTLDPNAPDPNDGIIAGFSNNFDNNIEAVDFWNDILSVIGDVQI